MRPGPPGVVRLRPLLAGRQDLPGWGMAARSAPCGGRFAARSGAFADALFSAAFCRRPFSAARPLGTVPLFCARRNSPDQLLLVSVSSPLRPLSAPTPLRSDPSPLRPLSALPRPRPRPRPRPVPSRPRPVPSPFRPRSCPVPVPVPVPALPRPCPAPSLPRPCSCPVPVPFLSRSCPVPVPSLSLSRSVPFLSRSCPLSALSPLRSVPSPLRPLSAPSRSRPVPVSVPSFVGASLCRFFFGPRVGKPGKLFRFVISK